MIPPLFPDTLDLAAEVGRLCAQRSLGSDESRAAMRVLGQVIGEGEASHAEALRRVVEAMEGGNLLALAYDYEREDARRREEMQRRLPKPKGKKPAEDRWDADRE